MVQNCCSTCLSGIGRVVCIIFCCTCCTCCKRKPKAEESQRNIELRNTPRPKINDENAEDEGSIYNGSSTYDNQYVIKTKPYSIQQNDGLREMPRSRPSTIIPSNLDNDSIYNGSSTYDIQSITKRQHYSESGTSGVYMSESSLYSGSITEVQVPSETKLELSCEIKGTVQVGGIPQPVKGILSIVPDENYKRPLPETSIYAVNPGVTNNVNLRNNSSIPNSLKKQHTERKYNKTPQPMPRIQEPNKNRASEMYFYKKPLMVNKKREPISEADNEGHYNEPKPPLPVKKRNMQDPTKSYVPVYENFDWKRSFKTSSSNENKMQSADVKFSREDTLESNNDHEEEHIYEDINLNYHGPYSSKHKSDDYEIYMP